MPVPFSLYAIGAGLALVLSFVVVGLFAGVPSMARASTTAVSPANRAPWHGTQHNGASSIALALLLLSIATGLFGTQNAFTNINMTLFWIAFVLGVPYAVAVVGDFYAGANPWRFLVDLLERASVLQFRPRWQLPNAWGYGPALTLYIAFIWLELFGHLQPRGLSLALLAYTAINVAGAWLLGKEAWFRNGEFFGVFLRLIGRMSPHRSASEGATGEAGGASRWRWPFLGLLEERVEQPALVVFILFMLSSTAFDGLHDTLPFASIFWKGIYPQIAPWFSPAPGQQYALSAKLYYVWQWCSLVVSPIVYLAIVTTCVAVARRITHAPQSVTELVLRFSPSLVPIALVYHVTHYYTLLLAQGGQLLKLVSDPFGWGWNLFGTARLTIDPFMIDAQAIWHTQVGLILFGHIVSVYLAHVEALRCFGKARTAALSQVPILVLMVLLTTLGLWILSLPLSTGA